MNVSDRSACKTECPNNAIYESGVEWAMADGTSLKGTYVMMDGSAIDADRRNAPLSKDFLLHCS
ncbi:hypothetical protein [Chitinophaga sp. CF418]|uniref:hypothetical protein n=1 Tax=Chitinophaga sp. CF418 TaxID=1855287 RepID=UPI00165F76BE|nr:hypothetical protein [Chitinophaga sp. CF418]